MTDTLVDRFLRYVGISSQSNAANPVIPSSEGQWHLAHLLRDELTTLGLSDIHLDAHGILTAYLPGTVENAPKIGFCAHMDTVDVGLSPDIKPQRHHFTGQDLRLGPDHWMRVTEHPELLPYLHQDIITSDGTSVLGADNKAAIAIIMTLLATLTQTRPPHGDLHLAFVPDEEIGLRGAKILDLTRFPVDWAYTIDACALGEFVHESFNAAQAVITIEGVTAHPISAKGILVNPILVATDLIARLDPLQTPEHTKGREGYCWVNQINGGQAETTLHISIRDFDQIGFETRKQTLTTAVSETAARFPKAKLSCTIQNVYANIASSMGNDRRCIALLEQAFSKAGVEPNILPMRGGTDGSALSARGIPTPNFFTGGLNFHSAYEFLPIPAFKKSFEVALEVVLLGAKAL